jgi:hypothetical protein
VKEIEETVRGRASMELTDSEDEGSPEGVAGEGTGAAAEHSSLARRERTMNAHIDELTQSIAVKEELIGQLTESREKCVRTGLVLRSQPSR